MLEAGGGGGALAVRGREAYWWPEAGNCWLSESCLLGPGCVGGYMVRGREAYWWPEAGNCWLSESCLLGPGCVGGNMVANDGEKGVVCSL